MYIDQVEIKRNLEMSLVHKFGEQIKNDVFQLVDKLKGKESYIANNLILSLQNILPLEQQVAKQLVALSLDLAEASLFAPILFLEKIPALSFYGLIDEIGNFLVNIKDYGARAVALFLGSDETNTLRVEDLIDVLEQSTLPFYKTLLEAVNARHAEFGVCCAMIMRFAAKMEAVISQQEITNYLDVCAALISLYGTKITEQYIRHAHEFTQIMPLTKQLAALAPLAAQSLTYVEFAVSYPAIVFGAKQSLPNGASKLNVADSAEIKKIRAELLKKEDYLTLLENPVLSSEKNFSALMMVWPTLTPTIRRNMLFQLQQENYLDFILANNAIAKERDLVNQATQSNWLRSWTYCEEEVDLAFLRKRLGAMLQNPAHFSLEAKSIVHRHKNVFDRANTLYTHERVTAMINIVLEYCVDDEVKDELIAMRDFLAGNKAPLRDVLSKTNLVLQTWGRDPWTDYGRSDEFFSCTGLGDYNAGNAPGFLADLNLNNLDVWNNGTRVGRIRFCLAKNAQNQTVLLLDCVDGTERMLSSQKRFDSILSGVKAYARFLGISQIKFNYDVDFNTTPKKFISYVEEAFQQHDQIDFVSRFLEITTSRGLIPYPIQTFLESFIKNNGGYVRGALISV